MIKYARGGRSIPHERVFKLDNDNLVGNKINKISAIRDQLVKTLRTVMSVWCVDFLHDKFVSHDKFVF